MKAPGEIVVAFDETRPKGDTISTNPVTSNWSVFAGGFADWAHDLEARGFTVRSIDPSDAAITSASLRGVDVLVAQPAWDQQYAYSADELDNMKTFLSQGGALLFVGEWGAPTWLDFNSGLFLPLQRWVPAQDAFLSAFGWTSAHTVVGILEITTARRTLFTPAALARSRITPRWPESTSSRETRAVRSPGCPRAPSRSSAWGTGSKPNSPTGPMCPRRSPSAQPRRTGGRMAVVMDSNFFDSPYLGAFTPGYWLEENRRFALQLVDWLAAVRSATPGRISS